MNAEWLSVVNLNEWIIGYRPRHEIHALALRYCDGCKVAVYPSAHDIDEYLLVKGYWPALMDFQVAEKS